MDTFAEKYYASLKSLMGSVEVTAPGGRPAFCDGISAGAELMKKRTAAGGKIFFIGNGASAAISSHQAADYWKNGGMRAIAFNDAASLTCVANDYGYLHVFEKQVEMFADKGDILVAISSSGRSENILAAAGAARLKGCEIITLSGFKPDNPLRALGGLNFYVPSEFYGFVEITHHSICHCMLEYILEGAAK